MNQDHASAGSGILATIGGVVVTFNPVWGGFILALAGFVHAIKPMLPPKVQPYA